MNHLDLDDELAFDPPHAYALLEGQGCACASRYYGGDCAHTLADDPELPARCGSSAPHRAHAFARSFCSGNLDLVVEVPAPATEELAPGELPF